MADTPIPPALSEAEWAGENPDGRAGLRLRRSGLVEHYWGNTGAWVEIDPDEAHAVAAMGNAALPDGDRRKITRATVVAMTQAAYYLENTAGGLATEWPADANPWHALAADLRPCRQARRPAAPGGPMIDPKTTHAIDQLTAYFGTLGSGYAAFIREAMASGATPEQATDGAKAALVGWMTRPLPPEERP